jgi:hypothetical protein
MILTARRNLVESGLSASARRSSLPARLQVPLFRRLAWPDQRRGLWHWVKRGLIDGMTADREISEIVATGAW